MDVDTDPLALPLPEFSASFPLPFRVLFLVGLAQLLWAVNLHVLALLGLDVCWVLDVREVDDAAATDAGVQFSEMNLERVGGPADTPLRERVRDVDRDSDDHGPLASAAAAAVSSMSTATHRPPSAHLYRPMYKLFLVYTAWCVAGYAIFRLVAGDDTDAMERWRGIVGVVVLIPLLAALLPGRGFGYRERRALRHALWRCVAPPRNAPIFFCDVILADILTSFAKVLGDLYVSAGQIAFGGITHGRVAPQGVGKWFTLLMVCLPYFIRLRQCLVEFYHSGWTSLRPLANACKYASAFPVILLSAAQRTVVDEVAASKGISVEELKQTSGRWFGEHPIFRLWLLAVVVNSMFSFYWDVQKDWGLSLLELDTWFAPRREDRSERDGYLSPAGRRSTSPVKGGVWGRLKSLSGRDSNPQLRSPLPSDHEDRLTTATRPGGRYFGLRPTLLLPDRGVYYLFTVLDLVLRFTWSLELSTHLHVINSLESGVFMMEALELIRRWMWVFIRVEWEAVRMGEMARFRGPNPSQRTAVLWDEKTDQ